jgi:hypothetical protein
MTIALGGEITPAVLQRATGTLQIIDAARMQCCEGARQAAYANEHTRYNRYRNLEEENTKKLIQFAQIAVGQPTANVPPVETAPKVGESTGAKKPTPKPAVVIGKKQVPKVHKWLSAYEPKAEERVIVTRSLTPTGPAASAVPGVPAETREKRAVMDVLKTPAKPNSYFGLPNK